ncbi:hypothetical protein GCM10023350_16780 [Nocardioides endophyticus]|uniref:Integrase catalytic domain-containing protein n=1 Tax=Nocardioides endophyticus TaxID=1353775 RepID=A0ABP8YSA6_9ACTN
MGRFRRSGVEHGISRKSFYELRKRAKADGPSAVLEPRARHPKTSPSTEAITGKPYKPTTQGKNERFHQTLLRYLDKQPLADTLAQLQAKVDAFDRIHNTSVLTKDCPGASRCWPHRRRPPSPSRPTRSRTGRSTSHRSPPCVPG